MFFFEKLRNSILHTLPVRRDSRRITLAVPSYNRPDDVVEAVRYAYSDYGVNDIIVYDDGSGEKKFQKMCKNLECMSDKVRIVAGGKNRGAFAAKCAAVAAAVNDWVILLDSDNSFGRAYVDRLFRIRNWFPDVIYCPDYAVPYFDFRCYGGMKLDMAKTRLLLNRDNKKFITTLLNTGNYFLNRTQYGACLNSFKDTAPKYADVLFSNYIWLSSGYTLHIVKHLRYYHSINVDSNFINKANKDNYLTVHAIRDCMAEARDLPESILSRQGD